MKRALLVAVTVLSVGNFGCLFNPYSSDPNERMHQMLVDSENMRLMQLDFQRLFLLHDNPSLLTPNGTNGVVMPPRY